VTFVKMVPLFLIIACPLFVIIGPLICAEFDGSTKFLFEQRLQDLPGMFYARWPQPSFLAAKIIIGFALVELILLIILPGATYYGPITPAGKKPVYKLNGVLSYIITHILLYVSVYQLNLFSPSLVYDNICSILQTLSTIAFIMCIFLLIKGHLAPETKEDTQITGDIIRDFFWGTEMHLHSRTLGFNLKQFMNSRFGMMGWSVVNWCCLFKQLDRYGFVSSSMIVSIALQTLFIFKFFVWESGYFGTIDIMHDRIGFYLWWGISAWVPGIYSLVSQYLVNHPIQLDPSVAVALFLFGVAMTWLNYDADNQRQSFRESGGKIKIWGKKPQFIAAKYKTTDGETRENLLLVSGWWSVSRHFHYIPEILLSLAWTLPALFQSVLPYFYVVYLTILLVHRLFRDEARCSAKYGTYWKQYCQRVPYRFIPYVF